MLGQASWAAAGQGPSIGLDSIALLPPESGARADLRIVLANVPVPRRGRGSIVLFHPNDEAVAVTVKNPQRRGGRLLACPVDGGTNTRIDDACVGVASGAPVTMSLKVPSGAPHVGLEFIGTWRRPNTVDLIEIRYKNVDYFVSARFASS
jgi:hypothetical protein